MNAAFIIAEYNPFHLGHEYHIKKTADALKPDAVACVMSGYFTQRGSAAIVDKWARARMALHAGADLVLELHPVYACSSAEGFARGALATIARFGVGGWLSFGAECADIDILAAASRILNNETAQFKAALGESLKKGKSFAAARQDAVIACCPGAFARGRLATILRAPNNILAIEYLRAIERYNAPLAPLAVPRLSGGDAGRAYAGASEIRNAIRNYKDTYGGDITYLIGPGGDIGSALPPYAAALLACELSLGRGPVFDDMFFTQLITILRRGGAKSLSACRDVGEGLESRIYEAARTARGYDELVSAIATRRYPASRVRRILTRVLLGFDAGADFDADAAGANDAAGGSIGAREYPPYIRVLGFNDTGRKLLASAQPRAPLITKFARLKRADARSRVYMELEARTADIYVTAFENPAFRFGGQDYIRGPVIF